MLAGGPDAEAALSDAALAQDDAPLEALDFPDDEPLIPVADMQELAPDQLRAELLSIRALLSV